MGFVSLLPPPFPPSLDRYDGRRDLADAIADPITASHIRTLEKDWGVQDPEGEDGDGWFEVVRPIE